MDQAVFLDRDGTLGGDGGFCHPDAFTLYPQAPHAIKLLNKAGLKVVVITNQSRIGHGEITLAQVNACFERLQVELAAHDAHLDAWYVCPHTLKDNCACRKPRPDLLQQAARDFDLDLHRSYMVGDGGATDMLAGVAAGCRTVLVLTGWGAGSIGPYRHEWLGVEPEYIANDVLDAAHYILMQEGRRERA
jgi:D-glycero-D-manno-heptose 1,7-bisphosphate phosphatase